MRDASALTITVTELFKTAGLQPCGPVCWLTQVTETKPGVYVIAIVPSPDAVCGPVKVDYLASEIAAHWLPMQSIIYIGRTRRGLSRRINEFYRHEHGKRSPHRGGQDVKSIAGPLWGVLESNRASRPRGGQDD